MGTFEIDLSKVGLSLYKVVSLYPISGKRSKF